MNYFGLTIPPSYSKSGLNTNSPYINHVNKASADIANKLIVIPNPKLQTKIEKGIVETQVDELGICVNTAMGFVLEAQARSIHNAGTPSAAYQEAIADVVMEFFAGFEESYDSNSGLINLAINHARGNGGISIIELDHRANQLVCLLQEDDIHHVRDYNTYVAPYIREYPEYVITAEFIRFLSGGYAVYVGEPKW